MIIVCEQCRTRFHLDDARIPARGARVRCSRCKHAFQVSPPGSEPGELAHALAGEAAEAGGAPAPEATRDLGEGLVAGEGRSAAAGEGDPGFEEDWQFNDDPPASELSGPERPAPTSPDADREPAEPEGLELGEPSGDEGPLPAPEVRSDPPARPERSAHGERPEGPAEAAGDEDPLDSVGSPESWDLLAELREEEGPGPDAVPPGDRPAAGEQGSASAEESSAPEREREAPASAPPEAHPAEAAGTEAPRRALLPERARALGRTAAHASGWLALAGLVGLALAGMLRPPAEGSGGAAVLRAGGWRSASARAVRLENARAGTLLLVTGRFERARAAGAAPRPAVQLVDAEGRPIPGARAALGQPLPERRLRLGAPARLRAELERRAPAAARDPPGEAVPLQAVFASVPAEAAGFVLVAGEVAGGGAPRTPGASPRSAPPTPPPSG